MIGRVYRLYFRHVLPAIGTVISGVSGPYKYLPASVQRFPSPEEMLQRMRDAGFSDVSWTPYTFGIAGLYRGQEVATSRNDQSWSLPLREAVAQGVFNGMLNDVRVVRAQEVLQPFGVHGVGAKHVGQGVGRDSGDSPTSKIASGWRGRRRVRVRA